jgi:hypothetical protein
LEANQKLTQVFKQYQDAVETSQLVKATQLSKESTGNQPSTKALGKRPEVVNDDLIIEDLPTTSKSPFQ